MCLSCAILGKKSKEEETRAATEIEALDKIMIELEAGRGARAAALSEEELAVLKQAGLGLLTMKPMIYAANVNEEDLGNQGANNVHVQVRG
jgi:ribosome-binding ATPase YchF (GTP1/OBG family)